jgi:hypothetical protein
VCPCRASLASDCPDPVPDAWASLIHDFYHLESVEMIMRGGFTDQGGLFSYIAPDKRVPANHPPRKVRETVRDVLSDLNRSLGRLYASEVRPSIPRSNC